MVVWRLLTVNTIWSRRATFILCRSVVVLAVVQIAEIPQNFLRGNCDLEQATLEPRSQGYPFDNRFCYATYFVAMSPILEDITDNTDRRQRAAGSVRAPEVR